MARDTSEQISVPEEYYHQYLERLGDALVGKPSGTVLSALAERREATVEWLVKRTGLRQNVVMKILHELYRAGVVDYRREKEVDTNWYVYYWRVRHESLAEVLLRRRDLIVDKLKLRLEYEKNNMFFVCPKHPEIRLTFDEAYDRNFKCPECGSVLDQFDNSHIIRFLEYKIKQLEALKPVKIVMGDP